MKIKETSKQNTDVKKLKLRVLFRWLWHGLTGNSGYILHYSVDPNFRRGCHLWCSVQMLALTRVERVWVVPWASVWPIVWRRCYELLKPVQQKILGNTSRMNDAWASQHQPLLEARMIGSTLLSHFPSLLTVLYSGCFGTSQKVSLDDYVRTSGDYLLKCIKHYYWNGIQFMVFICLVFFLSTITGIVSSTKIWILLLK